MTTMAQVTKPKKVTRSRGGCLNCKKRKKKCDEIKPICTGCYKRSLECEYVTDQLEVEDDDDESRVRVVDLQTVFTEDMLNQLLIPWSDPELAAHVDLGGQAVPIVSLPVEISKRELGYFELFCRSVIPELCILPQRHNHFIRIFLPMALREKGVLCCLLSWGCRLKKSHSIETKDEEYDHLQSLVMAELRAKTLEKVDAFTAVVMYMLLVIMELSFGDTKLWSTHFTASFHMLNKIPGTFKFFSQCGTEGRILAETFAYHDIMASQTNENGTFYPMTDYYDLLSASEETMHDPLQGCSRPLSLMIGKIASLLVEYSALKIGSTGNECSDRYGIISEMLEKANNLDNEISFCRPDMAVLKLLDTREELEYHLTLFEALQISTQLYLRQVIKNLPPIVPEVEMLTMNLMQDMKLLIGKEAFKKSLSFPMLLLGLCVNSPEDREQVKTYFDSLIKMCGYLSTYQRIWIVIQKVWDLNNNGQVYVDYFKISREMDWKINLAH